MAKFRSKLKGKPKGKKWQRGQSSTSNPTTQKHRDMAKSGFFIENLGDTGLTLEAIKKHDAMQTYGHGTTKDRTDAETELAIAKDLEGMSMKSGESDSESQYSGLTRSGTFRTFQTFASDFSRCTNMCFNKLLEKIDINNEAHRNILSVLSAVNEVIAENNGKQTVTEVFAALMVTLKAATAESEHAAILTLLSLDMKNISQAVLREKFSDSAEILMETMEKNAESCNVSLLRNGIGCLSVLLRAQDYAVWTNSSTLNVFNAVLAYVLHSKPKVRKSAHHAVKAILHGSCFMTPSEDGQKQIPKVHPAADHLAEFCISQIKAEALLSGHKPVLHTLTLLRDVISVFSKDKIKETCEAILSLMTHNNIYIKTCCLHALHDLFLASTDKSNLTAKLALQLLRALMAHRPPANDTRQVLAWAAVVQQGYSYLAKVDINLCMSNLPVFVAVCVSELWLSDVADINSASTNALRAVLLDCVKPAIDSDDFPRVQSHVESIFKTISTGLDNPFNQAIKHVVITIAVCFDIGSEKVTYILGPLLKKLIERRESHNFHNENEVEYATGCAIRSMGPDFVLQQIPLRSGTEEINIDRSWLLPVLKEKVNKSNLKYFATEILEMATFCRKKSKELAAIKDIANSHTYDLLCNQLWALLPSFCNNPQDIKDNFKVMARVLGNVLKDNPEFRLSVMQGLRKLINCAVASGNEEDKLELSKFAKNYLPILLNIYMSPAKGSSAEGQRLAALETISTYLIITDQSLREELFKNSLQQLETSKENHFQRESILDVVRLLVMYQSSDEIANLFENWVYPLCETVIEDKKSNKKPRKEGMDVDEHKTELRYKERVKMAEMEHKKAYRILEEIYVSENENCKEFLAKNQKKIKKMLMASLSKVADSSKAARLKCIEHLVKQTQIEPQSKLIKSAIAESVMCTRDINSKCRAAAYNLINSIGAVLKEKPGGLQIFLDVLLSGLQAPLPRVVSATLKAVASVMYNFSEDMGLETVQKLLETVAEKMLSTNREIVAAAFSFLKVYTKVLPTEVLSGSLQLIFKSLSSMAEDCKRHSRLEIGYFLSRMTRKYGAEIIEKLIPREDEVMLRRLRNIRKIESRKKRNKMTKKDRSDEDDDQEDTIRGTSKTLDEILQDSDSDMDYLDDEEDTARKPSKKNKGKNKAWIQDDPDNIVDLADVSAARRITATNPEEKKITEEMAKKKKASGFKTAPDGRLIIGEDDFSDDEPTKPSGEIDSDSDDTDAEEDKPSKLMKPGTKRRYDDILSIKSGVSNRSKASTAALSAKYKAGGKGIHRPISSGASVAGTEYSSRKAKGDIKKKGKHDPYAYLPLSRKNLNKRTKSSNKQFKGVVKSKTKGVKIKKMKKKNN